MIKTHKNKNNYYLTKTKLWVRDFTKSSIPEDINKLLLRNDYDLILNNEMINSSANLANIDAENIFAPNVIIVSDGYDFEKKQHLLKNIPQNKVTIIGTNRSLVKWAKHTRMDWYVVNNPYKECLSFLPNHGYYPRCVASIRTNPKFVAKYMARMGVLYKYIPVPDNNFSSNYYQVPQYYIDDYRNPICAAISLAYRWEVQRLMLFCCDDVFEGERDGAEKLHNGLWMYPQHNISHGLIDGNLHWLANQENENIQIVNHSAGPEYKNAEYIGEKELLKFFN